MSDLIVPEEVPEEVPCPCIRQCCLNENDVCLGCFRSLVEITGWHESDPEARRQILENAEERRRAHRKRYSSIDPLE